MTTRRDRVAVPLNRSERNYWATDSLAGAAMGAFILSFEARGSAEARRNACRELVSAVPRLRMVLERWFFSSRLVALEDDLDVDILFDDAFRVVKHVEPSHAAL